MLDVNQDLLKFLDSSVSQFHVVENISNTLKENGYEYISECNSWNLKPGKYFTTRNSSSLISFVIPNNLNDYHFALCASHSDSPTFKIKSESELENNNYLKLNVEQYGGAIDYTWLDKPLSIAGRVLVKENNNIVAKNLYIDEDLLIIPSLPIHMNRDVNKGFEFNVQIDMCPLFSNELEKGSFKKMISEYLNAKEEDIISYDLYLVNRQKATIWGYKKEFISAPKLDDLEAAYTSLRGYLDSKDNTCIKVYCVFDNEEVGSTTAQGAASTFMYDVLNRINSGLNKTIDEFNVALRKSFMVSFDNAHAIHLNHPEKFDSENKCFMNKGVVIKENANQSYTTDGFSRAIFKEICNKANVPTQSFANKSDQKGGSTLGNISNTQVSLHAVDIGLAQLAMHSSYETAGSKDTNYAYEAIKEYYSSNIQIEDSNKFSIK